MFGQTITDSPQRTRGRYDTTRWHGAPPLGRQRVLFSARPYTLEGVHRTYDVTPDGRRFVMLRHVANASTDNAAIVVVENVFDVLRRKMPP